MILEQQVHIDLAKLESLIRERGKPVHVNILTQTAVSAWLEQNAQARPYAPGDTYKVGETIQFNSRSATITATQLGYNPQQGNFQILTLTLPDSSLKHMAAGMVNAPPVDRLEITPERVQKMVAKEGLAWRTAVHNILATDERFVTFQDEQGDQYCLAELLPGVTAVELRQAWEIIQSEAGELFTTVATENLVADLWGLKNDGGDEYHLFAFALNIALQAYHKVQYVAGAGWMLAEHWQHMGKRPSLVGPRMANTVPEATDATEDEDEVATPPEATKTTSGLNPDLESWRQARRNEVAFTLRASHYYGRWLPLNKQTQQLFPPRPCQITIYHHFGEQEGSFTAVLDPKHKRILAKPAMYEAFHENGIYPGARLTISHRGTDYAYDIRTQPIVGEQSITVRRIALIDGQLEAWDDEEPVRYQIDGDVFVADARWEDLPALFHQAQNAGQGIFGLMFQICQRWQKERGKPLFVTATELFEEVSQQRLTSKATIAFELWRRLAFVAAEQGRYEFRAEKGGRSRLVARGHRSQTAVIPRTKQAQKTKSRHNIATDTQEVIVPKPPAFERTATGQLIATDLLPMGPLFDAASEKPLDLPRGTRCFIFQQRPDSEYEDRIGNYYSWKEGNPNSRQVQPGDRFIYYRPGEQVFFGMGQVEWIEKRGEDVDGRSLCEATISHYEAWKPPLPLTTALAKRISFIQSDVLGVGQAGIRRINPEDFHFLQQAYTAMRQGHPTIPTYPLPSPAPKSYTQPQETKGAGNPYWQGEFAQLQTVIQSQLNGTTIYTPTGRANQITQVLEVGLMVQSQRGEAVVLWEWVQQVYDKLRELGTIERSDVQHGIHHIAGGYRSAFIFGLLACFDHIEAQKPPAATLIYHTPTAPLCLRPQSSFAPPSDAPPPNPTLSTPSKPSTHLPGEDMTKTNKSLFSQHYLDFRLADQPEWQTDVMPALAQVQALYQAKAALLPQYKEAQTENEFIQPLLDILGFAYTVQPASKKGGQAQRPDYALFADGVAKTAADHHLQNDAAFFSRAIAICEAKYWERPLTQQKADSGRADFDNRNPSFQIVNYLTGTGVNWGMLTNGRLWRLYYRLADSTANEFYEIDLVSLLETADPESFKQFWLFFRREAFLADKTGRNFLERVREGSTTYARAVSDALKERVFNHVYPTLAGGFVANMAWRQEDVSSDEARALIQEATLSLLYKLLFLLYAEARDLLPVDNPGYRRHSLTQMVQEVAERVDRREVMGETATSYYGRLLSLFAMIDRGDAAFALPRYNGGLFHFDFGRAEDQQKHRANYFLHHHTINDARLAQALDLLARVEGQLVDYSFLEVRHLGAVYEGLLEYKLVIEEAAAGQVHLATDKGERKATGSYYTPDYIVKYIVHHTLDPILQAREQRFAQLMADIAPKRTRLEQLTLQSPNLSISQSPAVQSRHKNEAHILRQQLTPLEKEARETLLDIKVCDPAMGSGHFLVEAVDYLTDRLILILNQHPEHNPVLNQLADIRQSILDNMAAQQIAIDPARLDDTQLLQRAVMKRCIYGVDLNRMAVELAKLSLWLHSFTIGAPLSFLDHHLRWGNSLIGAMARDVAEEMQSTKTEKKKSREAQLLAKGRGEETEEVAVGFQFDLFGGPFRGLLQAANLMRGISNLSDATLAEVEQSEALFREFDEAAQPYKRLLDVYVAQHFGVKYADEFLRLYGVDVMDAPEKKLAKQYQNALMSARELFITKRFFHWDLEFPEVFIDLDHADWKINPGFDVIVGNPPYVRQEGLGNEKAFFQSHYEIYHGFADLYAYFIEQGIRVLCNNGEFGFIVSNKFMRANYGKPLRNFLTQNTQIKAIIDFGELPVFSEAATFPMIPLIRKQILDGKQMVTVARIKSLDFDNLEALVEKIAHITNEDGLSPEGWSLANKQTLGVLKKIEQAGIALGNYVDNQIYYGIKTGLNEAFFISQEQKEHIESFGIQNGELIKPLVVGDNIRNYEVQFQDRFIIVIPSGWTSQNANTHNETEAWNWFAQKYHGLAQHLMQFSKKAKIRADQGEFWWELRACDYYEAFEQPKIIYPVIAREPRFTVDENGYYANDKCFIIPLVDKYLLSLLNSRLIFETAKLKVSVLGDEEAGGRLELRTVHIQNLPIRQIKNLSPKQDIEKFITAMRFAYEKSNTKAIIDEISQIIGKKDDPDEIKSFLEFLADNMLTLRKEQQKEFLGFLSWLKTYTGLGIEKWSLITILQTYYLGTWDEFNRVLNRNAHAIQQASGVDVKGREALSRIKREYDKSVAVLTPLLQRIQATDRLIDQIVYKLYGLTDEEIAIVEGKGSEQ